MDQCNPDKFLVPHEIKIDPRMPSHSVLTLEPFEKGMGHTIGNALRRILLSCMPGWAITDVRIDGVTHEFTVKDGMKEDVLEVLMNLKEMSLRLLGGSATAQLKLHRRGPCQVLAKDFADENSVEVLNPDHVIATLTKPVDFDIVLTVKRGRGYEPVSKRKADVFAVAENEVGLLKLDASYSPVLQVAYSVENTHFEGRADLDRLVIDLKTNGTVSPEGAIRRAATILQQQLSAFIDLKSTLLKPLAQASSGPDIEPIFMRPIEELGLTARAVNCLKSEKIRYIGDLVVKTENDLFGTPNLGKKSLKEIVEALQKQRLSLGMILAGWPPSFLKLMAPGEMDKPESEEPEELEVPKEVESTEEGSSEEAEE